MGYRRILVTLDGSKLSELALEQAVMIADTDAYIHILSVISEGVVSETAAFASAVNAVAPVAAPWSPTSNAFDSHAEHARVSYLDSIREWLEQTGFHAIVTVATGDVIGSILEVAQSDFEVIVMASHKRTGMAKIVIGSVTDAVLSQAPCPVLIVPGLTN